MTITIKGLYMKQAKLLLVLLTLAIFNNSNAITIKFKNGSNYGNLDTKHLGIELAPGVAISFKDENGKWIEPGLQPLSDSVEVPEGASLFILYYCIWHSGFHSIKANYTYSPYTLFKENGTSCLYNLCGETEISEDSDLYKEQVLQGYYK